MGGHSLGRCGFVLQSDLHQFFPLVSHSCSSCLIVMIFVCVCVCVCVRERENVCERGEGGAGVTNRYISSIN